MIALKNESRLEGAGNITREPGGRLKAEGGGDRFQRHGRAFHENQAGAWEAATSPDSRGLSATSTPDAVNECISPKMG